MLKSITGSEQFFNQILSFLEKKASQDRAFANLLQNSQRSVKDCIEWMLEQLFAEFQMRGKIGYDDEEIYNMAVQYFETPHLKAKGHLNVKGVIIGKGENNGTELTSENLSQDYQIFISYKRNDENLAFPIKNSIEQHTGKKCWIDLDGIESDAQFTNVIIKAINKTQVFLFMYSHSHMEIEDYENDWTVREIRFAQKKRKRIVLLNLDSSQLTDWFEFYFGEKQQVDATSNTAMEKLYSDLRKWLK